ncbi:nucleotide-binding protein [Herbaspirillum seropedicae]|uniref:nucleotide-binding protein n=1 Tax=Herbaspirillum seropedicae TaxID=964 RepID=UPI00286454ED|nr:nucleotide-binding protein [Herbaspirillum seropedicae]MDR6397462.1 putative nucleotide-binding protein [Herbaspirillum seropedicae]
MNRDLSSLWRFIQPKFKSYQERRDYIATEFTPLLDYLEFGKKPEVAAPQPAVMASKPAPAMLAPVAAASSMFGGGAASSSSARNKRKVFIVHGRDNEAKQEVARYVSELGLEPIILHEQASSGMTIIEKIEHYTSDADFALVLYTACDHGRGIHESKVHPRNRARQNVVFEHGYLMAKLGRKNVCALIKGDIEVPNDISGVVYVALDGPGAWKLEVRKEMKACGYTLND